MEILLELQQNVIDGGRYMNGYVHGASPGSTRGRRQTRNLVNFVSQFWVRCSCFSKLESGTTGKFQIQDHKENMKGEKSAFCFVIHVMV